MVSPTQLCWRYHSLPLRQRHVLWIIFVTNNYIIFVMKMIINKANLRDLIAATGLVILLKLDSNLRFFNLEIWWMTLKNNRAPLLCYFKLFASFRSHWWIQTGVTVWKRLIWVKIDDFFYLCDLAVWRMPLKNNRASSMLLQALCIIL